MIKVIVNDRTIDLRPFNLNKPTFSTINNPYNPQRLFEGERKFFTASKPKVEELPLRNKLDGSFVVIASNLEYADDLLRLAQRNGLTVSGDGTCNAGRNLGDIRNIEKGQLITFGTSERFDVNWVARRQYAYDNGLVPVYDVVKDWTKVTKAIKEMADEKNKLAKDRQDKLRNGTRPTEPTFRTLKLSLVGDTYVSEQKKKVVEEPQVLKAKAVYGTMIGSSFIKSGYNIIPVREVRINPVVNVRLRPVQTFAFEIFDVE